MRRWIVELGCWVAMVVLSASVSQAANNFSNDAACKALWRFESGAMTTDSKGTNTLSDTGGVDESTGGGEYAEGSCAAHFDGAADYYTITDVALDAGFPLKNGDTNTKISVCMWFKSDVHPANYAKDVLFDKGLAAATPGTASFQICVDRTDGANKRVGLYFGYNFGQSVERILDSQLTLATAQWYHVGVTVQDSDRSYLIRIWDGAAATTSSGNYTNAINVEDGPLYLATTAASGTPNSLFDGKLDEVVVFNDILSVVEIDAIRAGTYSVLLTGGRRLDVGLNQGLNEGLD